MLYLGDSIDKANYAAVLQRNDEEIVALTAQHQARIATDMEFGFIAQDIEKYKADKDGKTFLVNEKVRQQESDDADVLRLERISQRQKAAKLNYLKR